MTILTPLLVLTVQSLRVCACLRMQDGIDITQAIWLAGGFTGGEKGGCSLWTYQPIITQNSTGGYSLWTKSEWESACRTPLKDDDCGLGSD